MDHAVLTRAATQPILTQELQWDQEYIGGSETRLGTMRALRPDHELLSSPGAGLRGANQLGLFIRVARKFAVLAVRLRPRDKGKVEQEE
jgi:hypothetical protein